MKDSKEPFPEEIRILKQELVIETNPGIRKKLKEDLHRDEELIAMIKKAIPD